MPKALYLVDFHTHVLSTADVKLVCPEDQESEFFRYVVPILEPIAHWSEPVHDQFLRYLAMHHNSQLGRFLFRMSGHLFLMEALRLFKKYGLNQMMESMDRQGIKHAVISSLEPLTKTQDIIDLIQPYQDRFSVFASVHREHPDPVGYLAPLIASGMVRGIKIHPQVGGYASNEVYSASKDFVELASDRELPVMIHTGHIPVEALSGLVGSCDVPSLEPLIRAFPKCNIILSHIGWESWRKALKLAVKYPNVIVETSWQPARIIRRAVDAIGPRRVIFGSDFPLFQQWQAVREVRRALTEKEFEMVASLNALSLLRLR